MKLQVSNMAWGEAEGLGPLLLNTLSPTLEQGLPNSAHDLTRAVEKPTCYGPGCRVFEGLPRVSLSKVRITLTKRIGCSIAHSCRQASTSGEGSESNSSSNATANIGKGMGLLRSLVFSPLFIAVPPVKLYQSLWVILDVLVEEGLSPTDGFV